MFSIYDAININVHPLITIIRKEEEKKNLNN